MGVKTDYWQESAISEVFLFKYDDTTNTFVELVTVFDRPPVLPDSNEVQITDAHREYMRTTGMIKYLNTRRRVAQSQD